MRGFAAGWKFRTDGDVRVGVQQGVLGVGVFNLAGGPQGLGLAGEPFMQGGGGVVALLLEEQVADGERDQPGADD